MSQLGLREFFLHETLIDALTKRPDLTVYKVPSLSFITLLKSNSISPLMLMTLQEILALTGGGKTREYTETRPDGTTVTYTIDVEEEIIEVMICQC